MVQQHAHRAVHPGHDDVRVARTVEVAERDGLRLETAHRVVDMRPEGPVAAPEQDRNRNRSLVDGDDVLVAVAVDVAGGVRGGNCPVGEGGEGRIEGDRGRRDAGGWSRQQGQGAPTPRRTEARTPTSTGSVPRDHNIRKGSRDLRPVVLGDVD